jgi:hypothetical protein
VRALILSVVCLTFPLVTTNAQTERVGTFKRQSIVIAFYRSPMYAVTLRQHIAARDSAKRAGDTAKVRALEAWGAAQQDTAHHQLEGSAPITNILDALKPVFDSLTKTMNLRAVVPATTATSGSTTVDVTPVLLDWLGADVKTREIIAAMPPGHDRMD